MNFTKRFRVDPGSKVDFNAIDPGFHGSMRMRTRRRRSFNTICSASPTAARALRGKEPFAADRAAGHRRRRQGRHLLACDQRHGPARRSRHRLQAADRGGAGHDFLWRIHPHAPARQSRDLQPLALRGCACRARHKLAPKNVWKPRYDFINDWEKLLAEENNTTS